MNFGAIKNGLRNAGLGLSGAGVIAIGVIAPWEGVRYEAYRDVGGVWTVCYGHTGPDIEVGKTYTNAECDALLVADINKHEKQMNKLITYPISDKTRAAVLSFTFNVGVGNLKSSTLLRRVNAGRLDEACDQLSRWVFVKKKFIRGLANRRKSERALCYDGLQDQPREA